MKEFSIQIFSPVRQMLLVTLFRQAKIAKYSDIAESGDEIARTELTADTNLEKALYHGSFTHLL